MRKEKPDQREIYIGCSLCTQFYNYSDSHSAEISIWSRMTSCVGQLLSQLILDENVHHVKNQSSLLFAFLLGYSLSISISFQSLIYLSINIWELSMVGGLGVLPPSLSYDSSCLHCTLQGSRFQPSQLCLV